MRTLKVLFYSSCFFWLTWHLLYAAGIQHTIQINTHLNSILGKPTWTLILRDTESGEVLPYQYDVKNFDNFWLALSKEHSYRITASRLKFGNYAAIANFCHLENGILAGKSVYVTLSGDLTPDPTSSRCYAMYY